VTLADNDVIKEAQRIAGDLLDKPDDINPIPDLASDRAATEPEAAADRVAEQWAHAAESLIRACVLLAEAMDAFADDPEKLKEFLSRLVARRVLSENDVLARLKANGKLSMLQKIGRHADTLLQPSVVCLLPAHYSIIYQFCLLIEEVGGARAELELSMHRDVTRDDIAKIREALKPRAGEDQPAFSPTVLEDSATQLFALELNAKDLRLFSNEYTEIDTLQRCLRHPAAADDAGLVAVVPILRLGAFERALMPLLGFDAPDKLYLTGSLNQSEITDRDVVVVAKRGKFRPRPLTSFPAASGRLDVLALEHPATELNQT
jgi:hypothetical protein